MSAYATAKGLRKEAQHLRDVAKGESDPEVKAQLEESAKRRDKDARAEDDAARMDAMADSEEAW